MLIQQFLKCYDLKTITINHCHRLQSVITDFVIDVLTHKNCCFNVYKNVAS